MQAIYNIINSNRLRFMRFGMVGILNTIIDIGIFAILFNIYHVPPIPAHAVGFLLAVGNSFVWNYKWTFRYQGTEAKSRLMIRFFAVALVLLALSSFFLWILKYFITVMTAKIAVVFVMIIISYVVNARYIFK